MEVIEFFVPGKPVTQGSKTAMRRGAHTVVVDRSNIATKTKPKGRLDAWRTRVRECALRAMPLPDSPWGDAVSLMLEFRLERPKSHHAASGALKPNAPEYPIVRPDRGKLARAVEDALTGVVYRDDSQVIAGATYKVYCLPGEAEGVHVSVARVKPAPLGD